MASFLNGLSAMGAGVAQFAGNAGLEAQRADLAQQQAVLADGLATARETKLQGQRQDFESGLHTSDNAAALTRQQSLIDAENTRSENTIAAENTRSGNTIAAQKELEGMRLDAKPPEARLAEWYAGASPEMRRGLLQYEGTKQGLPSWMIDGGSDQPSPSASAGPSASGSPTPVAGALPADSAAAGSPAGPEKRASASFLDSHGTVDAAALERVPQEGRTLVRNIILGLEQPPPPRVAASQYGRNVMELVRRVEPNFDATTWASRVATRKAFTTGPEAKAIGASNTAMGHAADLMEQFEKLGNWSGGTFFNKPANAIMATFGQGANVNTAKSTITSLASEARKIYAGAGGGSVSELNEWEQNFPLNGSPSEQRAAVQNFVTLLDGKLSSLSNQYNRGMGTAIEPFQLLDPKPAETYRRLLNHDPDASTGYQTGKPPIAATPTQAAPATTPLADPLGIR